MIILKLLESLSLASLPPPESSSYNQEEAEGIVEKRRMLLGLWKWMEKITYKYDIQDV